MVFRIFALGFGVLSIFYGIKYIFLTKQIYERWKKSGGGKFKIKNWRFTNSGIFTPFEIRLNGFILLLIGLLIIYLLIFPGPTIKPTDRF